MLWDHTKEKLMGQSNFLSEVGAEAKIQHLREHTNTVAIADVGAW